MKPHQHIIFSLLLLALPSASWAASSILDTPRHQITATDFKISGHLVRIDAAGARLSSNMTIKAHWFPAAEGHAGSLRLFVQLGQPNESHREMRQNILLEMNTDGQNTIEIMHPGDTKPQELPVDKWKQTAIGPGFDIEDFLEPQYNWSSQSIAENVKYGARICDLVTSKPGPSDRTDYSEIRTWLDHTIAFPVYAEKTVKGSGKIKEFTYLGIRHEEGVWSAHQIEAKLHGQPGSTLLIIDRGSAKAHLTAADFSPAQLAHF